MVPQLSGLSQHIREEVFKLKNFPNSRSRAAQQTPPFSHPIHKDENHKVKSYQGPSQDLESVAPENKGTQY